MSDHIFNVEMAEKFGVTEAIILRHFEFWILKNQADGKHFHEGRTWTYASRDTLKEIFPYLTDRKIRTAIKNLKEAGVVVTGSFSGGRYSRTTWFAFTDKYTLFPLVKTTNEQVSLVKTTKAIGQNDQCITDGNKKDINSLSKSVCARGTRFSLTELPDKWRVFCQTERPDLDPERTFSIFADHWRGVSGARGVKRDWPATWRNWVRRESGNGSGIIGLGKPAKRSQGHKKAAFVAGAAGALGG